MLCDLQPNEQANLWECPNCNQNPLNVNAKRVCKTVDSRRAIVTYHPSSQAGDQVTPDGVDVGTELKRLLKRFGFVAKPGCICNERAQLMNDRGAHWCEKHKEEIVDWLEEEATRSRLPFIRRFGMWIVKRAIRNANRKAGR